MSSDAICLVVSRLDLRGDIWLSSASSVLVVSSESVSVPYAASPGLLFLSLVAMQVGWVGIGCIMLESGIGLLGVLEVGSVILLSGNLWADGSP